MFKRLFNVFLLANGISSLDEKAEDPKQAKWAARREKFGDAPWQEQQSGQDTDAGSKPDAHTRDAPDGNDEKT